MVQKIVGIPTDPISAKDLEDNKFISIILNFPGNSVHGYTARFTYQKDKAKYFDDKTSDPAGQSIVVHYDKLAADAPAGAWDLTLITFDGKGNIEEEVESEAGQQVNVA